VLEAAGVGRARLLLVTTPVLGVSRAVIEHARRLNPDIRVVVRAESAEAMTVFHDMDVTEVVQPELEASIEMTRQALVHLRMSALDIVHLTDRLRADQYAPVSGQVGQEYSEVATLGAAARHLDLRWVRIQAGSRLAGRTIAESAVRTSLGVTIVGVVSGERFLANPGAERVLATGDLVAVVGDQAHVDAFDVAAAEHP
jgi:CPA2 family monovalent cation:H+ antiporter-2